MTREHALQVSDALVEAGFSHRIDVGVHERMMPRESYVVKVTPLLTFEPTSITRLQRAADTLNCEIAYAAGSFTFTERS